MILMGRGDREAGVEGSSGSGAKDRGTKAERIASGDRESVSPMRLPTSMEATCGGKVA